METEMGFLALLWVDFIFIIIDNLNFKNGEHWRILPEE